MAIACLLGLMPTIAAAQSSKASRGRRAESKGTELRLDEAADKKLLAIGDSGFKLHHTPHYVVAFNTDDAALRNLVHRIEVTYNSVVRFADRIGVDVKEPDAKLEILFFDSLDGYRAYGRGVGFAAGEQAPGFYLHDTNRSAFFNYANASVVVEARERAADENLRRQVAARSGARFDDRTLRAFEANIQLHQERVNRLIVQHEVAHQVLFNIGLHAPGVRNPRWFVEGLAMMFETPPSRSGAGLGGINQYRLGDWLTLEQDDQLKSWTTLVGDANLLAPTNPDAVSGYAQAWALVHYLQRTKRKQLSVYIDRIRKRSEDRLYDRDEEIAAFVAAFGHFDARFQRKFHKYIKRLPYRPSEG
ncbi:MAG: DUF1570 domain-containing protein [Phycisphaerae bacterium]